MRTRSAPAAADRLRVLPHFASLTPDRIAAWGPDIRRKHALSAIAAELDWERIGRDWVRPRDMRAHERLRVRVQASARQAPARR